MIVEVDLRATPGCVSARPDSGRGLSVEVIGSIRRWEVDAALKEAGAGCLPNHWAELSLPWLLDQHAAFSTTSSNDGEAISTEPAWIDWRSVDESHEWHAAAVRWREDLAPDNVDSCAHVSVLSAEKRRARKAESAPAYIANIA